MWSNTIMPADAVTLCGYLYFLLLYVVTEQFERETTGSILDSKQEVIPLNYVPFLNVY